MVPICRGKMQKIKEMAKKKIKTNVVAHVTKRAGQFSPYIKWAAMPAQWVFFYCANPTRFTLLNHTPAQTPGSFITKL